MDDNNVSLLIELLRQADEKLSRVEQRLERYDTFMFESSGDRRELKERTKILESKIEHISKLLSGSKKKGGLVILSAFVSALIGAGAIDWGKLFRSIMENK